MSGIRGKDTKPEIIVRKLLHGQGFRFRLHRKDLPGRPDIVLPKHRVAILVQGCFWHGHEGCHLFRLPKTRTEFWQEKIAGNRVRDQRNLHSFHRAGWRTLEIWECALKGTNRHPIDLITDQIAGFVIGASRHCEILAPKQ